MDESRLERLTDRQRDALRLVAMLKPYVQIADELGISESALKGRLESAKNKLGVSSARVAALALREWELTRTPLGSPTESTGTFKRLPLPPDPAANTETQLGDEQPIRRSEADRVQDVAALRTWPDSREHRFTLPIAGGGRRPEDIGWLARLGWTLSILAAAVVALGVLVIAAEGLRDILASFRT